eukprot:12738329-Ditylum_brightwellii.AAC.1
MENDLMIEPAAGDASLTMTTILMLLLLPPLLSIFDSYPEQPIHTSMKIAYKFHLGGNLPCQTCCPKNRTHTP